MEFSIKAAALAVIATALLFARVADAEDDGKILGLRPVAVGALSSGTGLLLLGVVAIALDGREIGSPDVRRREYVDVWNTKALGYVATGAGIGLIAIGVGAALWPDSEKQGPKIETAITPSGMTVGLSARF